MGKVSLNRRQFLLRCGTVIAAGAVMRPALAQLSAAHKLRPNSQRDQSSAFQQMLNEAARSGVPAYVPAGRYVISKINIPNGCALRGDAGKTVFVGNNNGPVMSARFSSRIVLADIVIDGTATKSTSENQGVLDLRNVTNASLSNVEIREGQSDGIYMERCGGNVERCKIVGAGRFGLFAVESAGLSVTSNAVLKCGNGGIVIHRWSISNDGTLIARNRISQIGATRGGLGQWGNGINIFQANGVTARQNNIADCAFSAIRMNSAYNTRITDNTCIRSGETAIYAEFAYRDVEISGNIIDGAANGISATNLNDGGRGSLITNNTIRNITAPGPYKPEAPFFGHGISVEADGIVRGNTIENANGYGINIGWGPYLDNVDVSGNLISRAEIGIGVSVAPGAGMARISGNKINARSGAIRTHQWDQISEIDLLDAPEQAPATVILVNNQGL